MGCKFNKYDNIDENDDVSLVALSASQLRRINLKIAPKLYLRIIALLLLVQLLIYSVA